MVAPKRLRELGSVAVTHGRRDLLHRAPAVAQEVRGAVHAHTLEFAPEARPAGLGKGPLKLARGGGDTVRDDREREVVVRIILLDHGDRIVVQLASPEPGRLAHHNRDTAGTPVWIIGYRACDDCYEIAPAQPEGSSMQVRVGMSDVVLTVTPGQTLHDAAKAMADRGVGAAVVIDPEAPGPGIVTERDVLMSVAQGQDPSSERVADHLSPELTFASPDWSLERAAEAMVRGGFRHLVVVDGGQMVGVLSMRDIVRCWVSDGATSELPSDLAEATGVDR